MGSDSSKQACVGRCWWQPCGPGRAAGFALNGLVRSRRGIDFGPRPLLSGKGTRGVRGRFRLKRRRPHSSSRDQEAAGKLTDDMQSECATKLDGSCKDLGVGIIRMTSHRSLQARRPLARFGPRPTS